MERERHLQFSEPETVSPLARAEHFVSLLTHISSPESEDGLKRYNVQNLLSDYARRHHQGSQFLYHFIPSKIDHLLSARSNGLRSIAIQDEFGIKLPPTDEELERQKDKQDRLGIQVQIDEPTPGIFSKEGAKRYELEYLIHREPWHIIEANKTGQMSLRDKTIANYSQWRDSFEEKHQEPFNSEANLLSVLRSPYEVTRWKRQMEQLGMS